VFTDTSRQVRTTRLFAGATSTILDIGLFVKRKRANGRDQGTAPVPPHQRSEIRGSLPQWQLAVAVKKGLIAAQVFSGLSNLDLST
jgi:hypothetical protein